MPDETTAAGTAAPGRRRRGGAAALTGAAAVSLLVGAAGVALGVHLAGRGGSATPSTAPGAVPSPRSGSAVAVDSATGDTVLFGGTDARGARLADTWTWDGRAWAERHPASSPPARSGGLLVDDRGHHRLVLAGGTGPGSCPTCAGATLRDTWTWDGARWHQEHPQHQPAPGPLAGGAWDADLGGVLVVERFLGGVVDSGGPAAVPPATGSGIASAPPRCLPATAAGAAIACPLSVPCVLAPQGGCLPPPSGTPVLPPLPAPVPSAHATALWNGSDWRDGPHLPAGLTPTAVSADPTGTGVLILGAQGFCVGIAAPRGQVGGITCPGCATTACGVPPCAQPGVLPRCLPPLPAGPALPGGAPASAPVGNAPAAPSASSSSAGSVPSSAGEGSTSVGSTSPGSAPSIAQPVAGHLWRLEGSSAADLGPLPFHSASPLLVAAGGLGAVALDPGSPTIVWSWSGRGWSRHDTAASPGARLEAAVAGDPAHSQVLLVGGIAGRTVTPLGGASALGKGGAGSAPILAPAHLYGDTWSFDGRAWSLRAGSSTPVAASPTPFVPLPAGASPG